MMPPQDAATVANQITGIAQTLTPLLTLGIVWMGGRVYQRLVALEKKVEQLAALVGRRHGDT